MTPEQWEHIGNLYHDALELPAPQRAAFLACVCGHDAALRHEVETLLAANEQADTFIAEPALRDAARLLTHDSQTFATGQTLGQYKILSLVGQGGMGEVYLATEAKLARRRCEFARVVCALVVESF